MYVLVVDTATPAVTAALAEVTDRPVASGVAALAARTTLDARAHGELLSPQIRTLLDETGLGTGGLHAIVAGVGPGPYTGLRVGLVTATAMGQALGVPTYGVCSLDGIGAAAEPRGNATGAEPGRVLAATDARRGEIYWRAYQAGTPITDPAVDRPAAVAERLESLGVTGAAGDGAVRYADLLGVTVIEWPRYPDPLTLAALAADRIRSAAPSQPLTPLYLRRPHAAPPGARKPVLR